MKHKKIKIVDGLQKFHNLQTSITWFILGEGAAVMSLPAVDPP